MLPEGGKLYCNQTTRFLSFALSSLYKWGTHKLNSGGLWNYVPFSSSSAEWAGLWVFKKRNKLGLPSLTQDQDTWIYPCNWESSEGIRQEQLWGEYRLCICSLQHLRGAGSQLRVCQRSADINKGARHWEGASEESVGTRWAGRFVTRWDIKEMN